MSFALVVIFLLFLGESESIVCVVPEREGV